MSENNFYNSASYNSGASYSSPDNASQWAYPSQGAPAYTSAVPNYAPKVEPPLDQPWYGIDIVNAVKRFFQKYATFSGRASRSEYWWSYLAIYIASFVVGFIEFIPVLGVIIALVFSVAIIVPSISIAVRRLHDTNRSGWFLLIPMGITFVGTIILFASFIPMIIELAEYNGNLDYMSDEEAFEMLLPVFGGLGVSLIFLLAGSVVSIVLMALPSKPEGVRFDKSASITMLPTSAQQPYSQPTYTQQPYEQQSYGQQSFGQSMQAPTQQQQPPEAQPPYSPMQ